MGGEGYILSNILMQTMARYGLVAALCVLVAFAGLTLLAYYLKARIDLMRQEETNRETERTRERQVKDQERQTLLSEVSTGRVQLHTFMNNHLAHDREEREALAKVLTEISVKDQATVDALREVAGSLKDHREEEAKRTANIHTKLEQIHLDVRDRK